jgi:hypothetical protein
MKPTVLALIAVIGHPLAGLAELMQVGFSMLSEPPGMFSDAETEFALGLERV